MTTYVELYEESLSYDIYGAQTVSGTLLWSGLGYVGKLSGSDEEIYTTMSQYRTSRVGIENIIPALVLLPFGTDVNESRTVKTQDTNWRIVWTNQDTQDSVQIYTKLIVERSIDRDGREDV